MLAARFTKEATKYINSLDEPTRRRIKDKVLEVCREPYNIRFSKPLKNSSQRSARVGDYRILCQVVRVGAEELLLVSKVAGRGEVYRDL